MEYWMRQQAPPPSPKRGAKGTFGTVLFFGGGCGGIKHTYAHTHAHRPPAKLGFFFHPGSAQQLGRNQLNAFSTLRPLSYRPPCNAVGLEKEQGSKMVPKPLLYGPFYSLRWPVPRKTGRISGAGGANNCQGLKPFVGGGG